MVRAASFGVSGRMVMQPPVSREEAEKEFGAAITENAWSKICGAFRLYGTRLSELDVTRANQNKNDERGWARRKSDAEKGIEAALEGLQKINRDFLAEAAYIVSLSGRAGIITGVEERLNRAMAEIHYLSLIVRDAEPLSREIMTEAESRKALARDAFAALEPFGAALSNGWTVAQTAPSHADLTGFERLAELLEIHQGETPAATSKWLREAIGTK